MKKLLTSVVAGLMMAGAGVASASEPVALSDSQMDSVSAGAVWSTSSGAAAALIGAAASTSSTLAVQHYGFKASGSSSTALAIGVLPVATTTASSAAH